MNVISLPIQSSFSKKVAYFIFNCDRSNYPMDSHHIAILSIIGNFMDMKDGICKASHKLLASKSGMGLTTFNKKLKELIQWGLISAQRCWKKCLYKLTELVFGKSQQKQQVKVSKSAGDFDQDRVATLTIEKKALEIIKRESVCVDNFKPDNECIELAKEKGLDIEEFRKIYISHVKSKGVYVQDMQEGMKCYMRNAYSRKITSCGTSMVKNNTVRQSNEMRCTIQEWIPTHTKQEIKADRAYALDSIRKIKQGMHVISNQK